jgi:hypothetical protein
MGADRAGFAILRIAIRRAFAGVFAANAASSHDTGFSGRVRQHGASARNIPQWK